MPALLEDPKTPIEFRRSGPQPYPEAGTPLPPAIQPRTVVLKDGATKATLLPYNSPDQVPCPLLECLHETMSKEILAGDTYPMLDPMEYDDFAAYWFGNFAAVMLKGEWTSGEQVLNAERSSRQEGGNDQNALDWSQILLGSYYIKPNYPGRSSHVCNAGFLVTEAARNKGVGKLMGASYVQWAPRLGYSYSVFNLVYETNAASCRIWDSLGFERIGRVKKCGRLKSYPDRLIDAIIYGRDLGDDGLASS